MAGAASSLFMDASLEHSAVTCPGHQDLQELPEPHVIDIFQHSPTLQLLVAAQLLL